MASLAADRKPLFVSCRVAFFFSRKTSDGETQATCNGIQKARKRNTGRVLSRREGRRFEAASIRLRVAA
eukprot:8351877-Alexandrium_andersonii.AAC.1